MIERVEYENKKNLKDMKWVILKSVLGTCDLNINKNIVSRAD